MEPMNKQKNATYLEFPQAIRRMAKMAAARKGISMSEYVADLVAQDAKETGIANLVKDAHQAEHEEVNDGLK